MVFKSLAAKSVDRYRAQRAQELSVVPLSETTFRVTGGTDPHLVRLNGRRLICDCRDCEKGHHCKHRIAVELHVAGKSGKTCDADRNSHAGAQIDVYRLWGETERFRVEEPRVAA